MLPAGFVTWTGGTVPSPSNQMTRWVPLTESADSLVKASVGTVDEKAVIVHIVDADPPGIPTEGLTELGKIPGAPIPITTICKEFGLAYLVPGPGYCPDPEIYLPPARLDLNRWRIHASGIFNYYRTGVWGGNINDKDINSADDERLTEANHCKAVYSLTPPPLACDESNYGVAFLRYPSWSSQYVQLHEDYHVDDFFNYWVENSGATIPSWIANTDVLNPYFDCTWSHNSAAGVSDVAIGVVRAHVAAKLIDDATSQRVQLVCVVGPDHLVNVETDAYGGTRYFLDNLVWDIQDSFGGCPPDPR